MIFVSKLTFVWTRNQMEAFSTFFNAQGCQMLKTELPVFTNLCGFVAFFSMLWLILVLNMIFVAKLTFAWTRNLMETFSNFSDAQSCQMLKTELPVFTNLCGFVAFFSILWLNLGLLGLGI